MPGKESLPPERLGDFLASDVGQRVLGSSMENVDTLVKAGMSEDQALSIALGAAAVREEDGTIMRRSAPQVEEAPELVFAEPTPEAIEPKKKFPVHQI